MIQFLFICKEKCNDITGKMFENSSLFILVYKNDLKYEKLHKITQSAEYYFFKN